MAFIREEDRTEIRKRFAALTEPVKLIYFTQERECQYCRETRQLLEELTALSDHLTLEVHDFVEDKALAEELGVTQIPATVLIGERDYGIRFYGVPSGYEFSTLLEDIIMVSQRDSGLPEATRQALADVTTPMHLQVFVTPTCPYCPQAVFTAHQFAMENPNIVADMVEATEFPHLAQRYKVRGVPKTVANDIDAAEGAVPADMLLENIREILAIPQN